VTLRSGVQSVQINRLHVPICMMPSSVAFLFGVRHIVGECNVGFAICGLQVRLVEKGDLG
jgi:hypothetical protein